MQGRAFTEFEPGTHDQARSGILERSHPSLASPVRRGGRYPLLSLPKVLTVAADATTIGVVMAVAFELQSPLMRPVRATLMSHALAGALSVPLWTAIFARYRLYTARRITSRLREFELVVHALFAGVFATAGVSVLLRLQISRNWLVLSFVLAVIAVQCERELVRQAFEAFRKKGRLLRPVIIVGTNTEAAGLCVALRDNQSLGCKVVGLVGRAVPDSPPLQHIPVLGEIDDLFQVLEHTGVNGVLIATTAVDYETSNRLTRQLIDAGVHVELSSSLRDIRAERLTVRALGNFPMIYVEPVRRGGWRAVGKRTFDIVAATSGLLILAPVLLVIAVLVKLDSPGPVLFRQKRVGKGGHLFEVFKFRTMVPEAELLLDELRELNEADGPLFKIRRDPRVTRLGRALRAFALDELPQLWNVLRNEMSIVGPRPALPQEVRAWSPQLHQRLRVKPGLTGMWQVNGRINVPFAEYMRLDLYYVDNWSLWMDLAIVIKTVPTLLFRKGGY
jgi:exopolysaccharide biosynthesis polyprenyl glycosylphosphotransferase